jgi:hypothetical protein
MVYAYLSIPVETLSYDLTDTLPRVGVGWHVASKDPQAHDA